MLSQSMTAKFIKSIGKDFSESAMFGLFTALAGFFKKLYDNSLLKSYVEAKPFINGVWGKSFFAFLTDKIFLFIARAITAAGNLCTKVFSGSLTDGVLRGISKKIKYHHVLGLIFAVIFLVYSDWWNNMYAAAAAFVMTVFLIYKKRNNQLLPSKTDFFMVLFLISAVLGIFAAGNKTDAVRIAVITVSALLFHLCTVYALTTDEKLSGFVKIISVTVFITAIVAISQRIAGIEVDPEFVDLANNEGMPGRVFSTMENPNNYAELLVLFMPFMFAVFVNEKRPVLKLLWFVMAAAAFVALAMTYSRSCYVALVIAILVFLLVYDYHLVLPVMLLALLALPFMPETVFNRILTIGSLSDSSNSYRLYIWDVCVRLARDYGISGLGIGPASFRSFYRPIAYRNAIKAPHSHMLYLELILEYGIAGFIGFMGYYIRIIRNGFKSVKLAGRAQRAYLGAGIGALLGISFVCLAEYIWFYPRDMFAHFIVMGILIAQVQIIARKGNGA